MGATELARLAPLPSPGSNASGVGKGHGGSRCSSEARGFIFCDSEVILAIGRGSQYIFMKISATWRT